VPLPTGSDSRDQDAGLGDKVAGAEDLLLEENEDHTPVRKEGPKASLAPEDDALILAVGKPADWARKGERGARKAIHLVVSGGQVTRPGDIPRHQHSGINRGQRGKVTAFVTQPWADYLRAGLSFSEARRYGFGGSHEARLDLTHPASPRSRRAPGRARRTNKGDS